MIHKRTRRLRARAAALHSHEDFEDYGPEPNMKLSHAFLVVLMLHVVAVGGLFAFNSMKASRQASLKSSNSSEKADVAAKDAAEKISAGTGGGAGKPPEEDEKKALPVAKTPQERESVASKGLLAGLRSALHRGAVPASVTAVPATAAAQDGTSSTGSTPSAAESTSVDLSSAVAKTYTVKAGDTVTRIASELGTSIPELEKANGMDGKSVLQVGQVLKVPVPAPVLAATPVPVAAQAPGASTPSPAALAAGGDLQVVQEYTIVKGDNPYKLAKKFRVTPEELMKVNGITDPKKIQIGQKLKIPAPTKKGK